MAAGWSSGSFGSLEPYGISWSDMDWHGTCREVLVIYELHVGTFTPKGTFSAIIERLGQLRVLGITAIELMPVAQFPGRTSWGYDGIYWYAVQHSYGGPRELQQLVDACHRIGISVLLDVAYNYLGPEGNYLGDFGPYFKSSVQTPWGDAVNYDEPGSSTQIRRLEAFRTVGLGFISFLNASS